MKNPAFRRIRSNAQAGFTLIELIVVIVILGILAATALPRFANLGNDARVASLNAARGALASTVAMTHGKFLANTNGVPLTFVTYDGVTVDFAGTGATATGYPKANAGLLAAAGITGADYLIVPPSNTASDTTGPTTSATQVAFVPISAVGTPAAQNCFVRYTEAVNATTPPVVTVTPAATAC